MRVAVVGVKGLPHTYSGVETHVREVGTRLVKRGHEVTVYVRPQYSARDVQCDDGIRLIHLPTIRSKHLDASIHSFLAALHSVGMDYHIIHFHTIGPGFFAPVSRLSRARIVTTIHRFDYLSGKWGWFARACLRLGEQVSLRVPHATIVVAPFLQTHYQQWGHQVEYIPNGVPIPPRGIGAAEVQGLGLTANQYVLFLGRLVPEKRPNWAIDAFEEMHDSAMRLVIAGGSSATDEYVRELKALARPLGDRIIFTGPVYGRLKDELLANARLFILPSALEGLPITLLEAMSHGRPCLVSDIPPHRDVIREGENGFLHDGANFAHLRDRMSEILHADPETLSNVGESARETVVKGYDWERVVDQIERLYERVLGEG